MSVEGSTGDAAQGQSSDTRFEAKVASADSQETMTTRCLTEIASLVVASLEPFSEIKEDDEGAPSGLSLMVATDSLLSEPASGMHCHLGATLSGITDHAPVLRNRHVAASPIVEANLSGLSFLLLSGGTWKSDSVKDMLGSNSLGNTTKKLVVLWNVIFPVTSDASEGIAPQSGEDQLFHLLVCSSLIAHARAVCSPFQDDDYKQGTQKCLECVFEPQSFSLQSNVFVSRFAALLKLQDVGSAYSLVLETQR
jgi:hypothetical protein